MDQTGNKRFNQKGFDPWIYEGKRFVGRIGRSEWSLAVRYIDEEVGKEVAAATLVGLQLLILFQLRGCQAIPPGGWTSLAPG